mgnify:CR=1 FL=1
MKRLTTTILSLSLLFCGCAPAFATAAPAQVREGDPALWLLSDEDTDIYLFGTVHFLPADLLWFDDEVRSAFDRSDALVLEMLVPSESEMAALIGDYGYANDGIGLRDRLSPESRRQYEALMKRLDLPRARLDGLKPWYAFMTLYQLLLQRGGLDSALSAEQVLTGSASGKQMIEIESAREQLAIFDALSLPEQMALLQSLLDNPDAITQQTAQIIGYWADGDIVGLDRYLAENSTESETEHALIFTRNRNWVEWLDQRLDSPGTYFVAVGAAHLAGPDNVRELLRERGLDARRVEY